MSSQARSLETWLRQQIFRERKTPLEKFVLRSALPGNKGQEVEEFTTPDGGWNGDQIPALRDEILGRAQDDTNSSGVKLQRFILVALEMGENTGPRFPFRIRGEEEEEGDGEEAPSEKGIISQLMRHNEVMMRTMTQGQKQLIDTLTRQNQILADQNQMLMQKQVEGFQAIEEARGNQHQREMELLAVGGAEERKTAATQSAIKKIDTLLPLVMTKLTGGKLLTSGQSKALEAFTNSLTPSQAEQIGGMLSPEQQILFLKMVEEQKKEEKK